MMSESTWMADINAKNERYRQMTETDDGPGPRTGDGMPVDAVAETPTTFKFAPTTNRIATIADTRCHVALFMNREGGGGELVISVPDRSPHRIEVAPPKEGWHVTMHRYPDGSIEVLYTEDKAHAQAQG